jgi:hypothetical protein
MTVSAPARVEIDDITPEERVAADLAEARAILRSLLESEDRIGRVYVVMDHARLFLARTARPH